WESTRGDRPSRNRTLAGERRTLKEERQSEKGPVRPRHHAEAAPARQRSGARSARRSDGPFILLGTECEKETTMQWRQWFRNGLAQPREPLLAISPARSRLTDRNAPLPGLSNRTLPHKQVH